MDKQQRNYLKKSLKDLLSQKINYFSIGDYEIEKGNGHLTLWCGAKGVYQIPITFSFFMRRRIIKILKLEGRLNNG